MTDLLEKEDLKTNFSDTGDHDRFQHYFYKKDINENLLTGKPMRALCGKVVAQQVDPKGRTVCPECQEMMDTVVGSNLPNGGNDE